MHYSVPNLVSDEIGTALCIIVRSSSTDHEYIHSFLKREIIIPMGLGRGGWTVVLFYRKRSTVEPRPQSTVSMRFFFFGHGLKAAGQLKLQHIPYSLFPFLSIKTRACCHELGNAVITSACTFLFNRLCTRCDAIKGYLSLPFSQ